LRIRLSGTRACVIAYVVNGKRSKTTSGNYHSAGRKGQNIEESLAMADRFRVERRGVQTPLVSS
jgi:hypothetical protein